MDSWAGFSVVHIVCWSLSSSATVMAASCLACSILKLRYQTDKLSHGRYVSVVMSEQAEAVLSSVSQAV